MKKDTTTISDRARAVLALDDEVQMITGQIDELQRRINSLESKREAIKVAMVKLWKGDNDEN